MYNKTLRIEKIQGWGNFPKAFGNVFRPERINDLYELFGREVKSLLARGGERSYGDASINIDGINIDTKRLNKMLNFDPQKGVLHCQSGVTVQDIVKTFLPKGWILNVTPGTQFSTVGGCVACDAHGKNWKAGSFCNFVLGFNLLIHDGDIIYCDANQNSDIYYATIGGMGMTGIILDVYLQLKKISSAYMDVENIRFNSLKEAFELLYESMDSHEYLFSWLDSHKEGKDMGRGILQRGVHSGNGCLQYYKKKTVPLLFNLPSFTMNRYSVEAFNTICYFKKRFENRKKRVFFIDFFYPLDSIANWNRIYGKTGFVEYQVVIPFNVAYETISELLQSITKSKLGSIIAVLKPLMKSNGIIAFPIEGFTLAVDFPYSQKVLKLLNRLDNIVSENGGRVYLAKDARLTGETFRKMYSESLDMWESVREKYNIENKFSSLMFNRLYKS
ncbi:MAG: FAD-binding protein [Candidatus Thorarchaeota archaeon]